MGLQNTLGFKIPERTAPSGDSFLLNPKALADWVSTLPMANVGETSRQVFKTIVEFNRVEIPILSRIKCAEQFRRPISYISENLQKYFFDTTFPLTAKNRKIAVLNRELYTELALCYKIYIESAISGQGGKIDRKLLVIAIHRALRYLSMVIYQSILVYDPVPENTWREIHRLYAFAEKNRIHELPVNESSDKNSASTITQLYKQVLLFSVSSPYRMRQREIRQVVESLEQWSRLAKLESARAASASACQFITRLASDSPPLHHTLVEAGEEDRSRILDTQGVVKALRESLEGVAAQGEREKAPQQEDTRLSSALRRQLIEILNTAPKRRFVRTRLNFELKIAVGVSAINSLLSAHVESQANLLQQPTDSELAWLSKESLTSFGQSQGTNTQGLSLQDHDVSIEETIVASSIEDAGFAYPFPTSQETSQPTRQPETFACKTVNESAGGYCINWQGLNAPKIKIGEVIGIQSATNSSQFTIGISRWMKNVPGQGLLLGMQIIAPISEAVLVHHLEGVEIADRPHKGLLLPQPGNPEQTATLVLPTLPFKKGSLVMINNGQGEHKATLTSLLESTGAFAHFEFRYQKQRQNGGDPHADSDDFDNVWSML